jgi:hypothetical protein
MKYSNNGDYEMLVFFGGYEFGKTHIGLLGGGMAETNRRRIVMGIFQEFSFC